MSNMLRLTLSLSFTSDSFMNIKRMFLVVLRLSVIKMLINLSIFCSGYMAPEYLSAGYFSVKSDVYGFGIIVLELVSGLRNKYLCQQQNDESLLYQVHFQL